MNVSPVKVIRCRCNAMASDYIKQNGLRFYKCNQPDRRRYDVYMFSVLDNRSAKTPLGMVFYLYGTWCFIPLQDLQSWYFGHNRAEAISGYLKAMGLERSMPASVDGGAAE